MKPTYSSKPDPNDFCETVTANICTTTTSYNVVAGRGLPTDSNSGPTKPDVTPAPKIPFGQFANAGNMKRAVTTATTTISFCTKVTGCGFADITSTTEATSTATPMPYVIIPKSPKRVGNIRTVLRAQTSNDFFESASNTLGTIFFFAPALTKNQVDFIRDTDEIDEIYIPRGNPTYKYWLKIDNPGVEEAQVGHGPMLLEDLYENLPGIHERLPTEEHKGTRSGDQDQVSKRDEESHETELQEMVLLSWHNNRGQIPKEGSFNYDENAGKGTFIYSVDYGVNPSHPEFKDIPMSYIYPGPIMANTPREQYAGHGTKCLAKAVGKTLGIAKRASAIVIVIEKDTYFSEHWLDALVRIHEDMRSKGRGPKSSVNMSIQIMPGLMTRGYKRMMAYLIRQIQGLGAVVVTGSGNCPSSSMVPQGYPALYRDPADPDYIEELLVVGGSASDGQMLTRHCRAPYVQVFAPSMDVKVPEPGGNEYQNGVGTSYGKSHTLFSAFFTSSSLSTNHHLFPIRSFPSGGGPGSLFPEYRPLS